MEYTKEQIEKMAEEYAQKQNSAYTNDYYGFIAGFEKALSLFAVSGSVCEHDFITCGTKSVECTKCKQVFKSQ